MVHFQSANAFQYKSAFRACYGIASKQEAPCLLWLAAGTHLPGCFLVYVRVEKLVCYMTEPLD